MFGAFPGPSPLYFRVLLFLFLRLATAGERDNGKVALENPNLYKKKKRPLFQTFLVRGAPPRTCFLFIFCHHPVFFFHVFCLISFLFRHPITFFCYIPPPSCGFFFCRAPLFSPCFTGVFFFLYLVFFFSYFRFEKFFFSPPSILAFFVRVAMLRFPPSRCEWVANRILYHFCLSRGPLLLYVSSVYTHTYTMYQVVPLNLSSIFRVFFLYQYGTSSFSRACVWRWRGLSAKLIYPMAVPGAFYSYIISDFFHLSLLLRLSLLPILFFAAISPSAR